MASRFINQSTFLGYNVNSPKGMPLIEDAMAAYVGQLENLMSYYSSVFFVRFDLAFPEGREWQPREETANVGQLFQRLRMALKTEKHGQICRWVYGWTREHESAKKGHVHCFVAIPYRFVRSAGLSSEDVATGLIGLVGKLWADINGEFTRVHISGTRKLIDAHSLGKAIYHVSYLAKTRSKVYGKNTGHRNWAASRLKSNPNTPRPSRYRTEAANAGTYQIGIPI